jgi:hypothetical protein
MLIEKLNQINSVLNKLIQITEEDIKNIKLANHEEVFKNIKEKEDLSYKFYELKSQIDSILVERNKPLEEIFSKEEEIKFDEFRNNLHVFYQKHKLFSKLALSVANFYNTLVAKLKNETKISYTESANFNSNLTLKA